MVIGISYGLWANGIDWGVVGIAAGVGLVLGLLAGKTALRWLTECRNKKRLSRQWW